ncbi:MAG: amidohydrolase family protein [Bacteroidota bacterium]
MIIDCHTHVDSIAQIADLQKSMQANNIAKSIILFDCGMKTPTQTELLKEIEKYDNLYLAVSTTITDKNLFEKQFNEVKSIIENPKVVGFKLYLGYEYFYANDERCFPIYELCLKLNIPVIFHTGDTLNADKKALIKYANPIYLDDVAVKYPKLKIVIAHIGNPLWINETAELVYKNKNIYTEISGILHDENTAYSKRYNSKLKEQILDLIAYVGASDKIMFGTDYPYFKQKDYIDFICFFDEFAVKDKENILFRNAEYLFKLKQEKL